MDASNNDNFLSEDLIKNSLNEISDIEELAVSMVLLSGGEPLLYPNLNQIIASLPQTRKYELCIITNGTLIDQEQAAFFRRHNVSLQVSIDGPSEYHNEFRGVRGTFEKASQGIKHSINEGVPVSLLITVCQDNLTMIPYVVKWAAEMSISNIKIQPLSEMGRGHNLRDKKLSESQLCDLFFLLSDMATLYKSKGLRFTLGFQTRQFLLAHPCAANACYGAKCHRKIPNEVKQLVIREDGTVLPEISTLNYRFALGNLKEKSLKELVSNYFSNPSADFVQLCRDTYKEIMPTWPYVFVPWDEIISERSNLSKL